jgi:hypothetical protein
LIGKWRNVSGAIRRRLSGTASFAANTSEPSVGRRVCDAQGNTASDAHGRWTAQITEPTASHLTGPHQTAADNHAE